MIIVDLGIFAHDEAEGIEATSDSMDGAARAAALARLRDAWQRSWALARTMGFTP